MSEATCVHGTAIAVDGHAVLIRGPSGSGKSDLALRALAVTSLTFTPTPPELVADDQVIVERAGAGLSVKAPDALRGLIEVRGVGIVPIAAVPVAELVLLADICPSHQIDRLPDPPARVRLLGIDLPLLRIEAFEPSAPLKLLLALAMHRPAGA